MQWAAYTLILHSIYLSFEGAEKVWEWLFHRREHNEEGDHPSNPRSDPRRREDQNLLHNVETLHHFFEHWTMMSAELVIGLTVGLVVFGVERLVHGLVRSEK